jgi:hypothetical protein
MMIKPRVGAGFPYLGYLLLSTTSIQLLFMLMPYASFLQETLARVNQTARDHKLLSTFLGRVKGAALIPLAYLVHEREEVTPEIRNAEYGSSVQERLRATTASSDMHFD